MKVKLKPYLMEIMVELLDYMYIFMENYECGEIEDFYIHHINEIKKLDLIAEEKLVLTWNRIYIYKIFMYKRLINIISNFVNTNYL